MAITVRNQGSGDIFEAYQALRRNVAGADLDRVELLWEGFDRLQRERLPLLEENRQMRISAEAGPARGIVLAGRHHCYINGDELAELLEVSPATIKRWEKAGVLPPPVRVPKESADGRGPGRGFVRWDLADVVEYLERYKRY